MEQLKRTGVMGKGDHTFHRFKVYHVAAHHVASGQWFDSHAVILKLDDLGSMELLEGSEALVLQVGILLLLRLALHPVEDRVLLDAAEEEGPLHPIKRLRCIGDDLLRYLGIDRLDQPPE